MKSIKPIIFGSASISCLPKAIMKEFIIKPPIKKGDLDKLHTDSPVLIIDGYFGNHLAITPKECLKYLNTGRVLMGSSSMGAIRASELWQYGMIGIGTIYNLYRLGHLQSDADVAVLYSKKRSDQSKNLQELTYSIAHIAAVLLHMEKLGFIIQSKSYELIQLAKKIHFEERFPTTFINSMQKIDGLSSNFFLLFKKYMASEIHHPKIKDAHEAIGYLLCQTWLSPVAVENPNGKNELPSVQFDQEYHSCKCCSAKLSATAIFCPYCVSYAHENQ